MNEHANALMNDLMKVDFAIIELNLYLDTHPNDKKALDLYNEFVEQSNILRREYEEQHAPLTSTMSYSKYPWQWVQGEWPWNKNYVRKMGE